MGIFLGGSGCFFITRCDRDSARRRSQIAPRHAISPNAPLTLRGNDRKKQPVKDLFGQDGFTIRFAQGSRGAPPFRDQDMSRVTTIVVFSVVWFAVCRWGDGEPPAAARFGAEANSTGQPLGGGAGYLAGVTSGAATFRVTNRDELAVALKTARCGEVVWIQSGLVIDFSGMRLEVPAGVIVAEDRGQAGSPGPLLTTKHTRDDYFILLAQGARLTGLRIRGSNPLFRQLDDQPSEPSGYAISCSNGEVDNCEVSQFRRAGVAVFQTSERSHIHHNNFHDIAAYPILIANGAGDGHTIEANRIEWAWHAIASNGARGSGYTARHNEFIRVTRPKQFEQSGPSPSNWCLDVHGNDGADTRPARPKTRKLIVYHNTFLVSPGVQVGDGHELLTTNAWYPKYDIFVGSCPGVMTTVDIHHNRFLMHTLSGTHDPWKPYGLAV
jgi:hypothetical protein